MQNERPFVSTSQAFLRKLSAVFNLGFRLCSIVFSGAFGSKREGGSNLYELRDVVLFSLSRSIGQPFFPTLLASSGPST